ncbi:peptidase, partial [Gardnerella vaginalis]
MANSNRKKHAREQVESSFKNVDSSSAYATMRKVSLSTLATVLTAATCLGGQPILASSNILLPPTTAAFAQEVRNADTTPWLHTPNILEFQRYRFANSNGTIGQIGSDGLGDYSNTTKKSDMYAHLEENNGAKYLVFDVFFNNDGKDMTGTSKQQQYVWQIPFAVADLNNGYYKPDTLSDLSFDFYKRNGTSPQTTNAVLSRDFSLFTKENSQSKNLNNPLQDDQHLGNSLYKITLGIRGGNSNKQDLSNTFHKNAGDGVISNATTLKGVYSGKSYGIGLRTTNVDYAVHMHCKVKLRQGVTLDEIQDAYTWANTSTYGKTTNSAYTFISGREHWTEQNLKRTKSDNTAPKLYFNGKEISDSNNSITVYQGDSPTIKFGTSDDSGKVTKFSVSGLPDFAKNGNVDEKNDNGIDASESNPHTKVINKTTFIHKDKSGNPVNSDYTITVSATDTSGNKAEKQVKIKLENLNKKYKEPTATPITVDWGHALTENDLKPHVTGIEGGGKLVFNPFPQTNIPQEYFNGRETLPTNASAKVVYSDNSYHVVTIPVNIKKPLSLQHKLNGNTVNATVGDKLTKTKDGNKVDAKEYLGITDKNVKDKIKSAEWVNGEPSTDVAGKRTYTAKVTFNDGSTAEEKITFTVKPKKPTIETDLTGVAGVKNKEVVVNAGPGTAGSTVTLKDKSGKAIGTGTVGADGKVTITVANGIPEGNITAVTTTADSVSSDASDAKKATKDNKAPTLTADKDSVTVKVGEDLKIQLTAKDDVKIESIDTATATMALFNNDPTKLLSNPTRAGVKYDSKNNTDTQKKLTYTFSGFKPEEVGTYTLTFSATDAAGHKTEKTVTVKVEKKEDIKPRNITVDLGHKLDEKDAKKAIANHRSLP